MNHKHAHQHLAATHPRLAALIARSLPYNIKPALSIRPFDALAESIAYQQLSGKAAATIFGRVRALYPRRKYLDPKQILVTPDDTLRLAGLSRAPWMRRRRRTGSTHQKVKIVTNVTSLQRPL